MKYIIHASTILLVLLALNACADGDPGGSLIVREASGIVKQGDRLIIVGDDADGRYFELDLEGQRGPIIPIDPEKVREVILPGAGLAMDLEGVDVLADGRIVFLSEQLRCLLGGKGEGEAPFTVVAEYGRTLSEFGNRGLEGLAVKGTEEGGSLVAVMWEGGYPEYNSMPRQLRDLVGHVPLKPVIVVHEVAVGGTVPIDEPMKSITLDVPEPAGEEPTAQRLRGSDLVWFQWPGRDGGEMQEGFIVLMTSENSPPDGSSVKKAYKLKLIQRFDMEGRPVGEPLNLNEMCLDAFDEYIETKSSEMDEKLLSHCRQVKTILDESGGEEVNWEGLGWFEEGKSLIAIYDTWPKDPPFALIFDIPDSWKRVPVK